MARYRRDRPRTLFQPTRRRGHRLLLSKHHQLHLQPHPVRPLQAEIHPLHGCPFRKLRSVEPLLCRKFPLPGRVHILQAAWHQPAGMHTEPHHPERVQRPLPQPLYEQITQARFSACDLQSSDLSSCKFSSIAFEKCNLRESEFSHTPLRSIDLSQSDIEGIRANLSDLRGAIVNTRQALDLTALMGLKITYTDWNSGE